MKVIQATAKGMCFGVRDAVDLAMRRDDAPEITIWGELVHNEFVLDELDAKSYAITPESARKGLPATDKVLITAHGISDKERRRLTAAGKTLIDTTCPLVRRVHGAARELERDGCLVIVIGRPGHVEVRGIVGDLRRYRVVAGCQDVKRWRSRKIGVVCQSTVMAAYAREIVACIEKRNPRASVRFLDTICDPTKQRILALEALIPRADAVVVVGGKNSNNTRQLVQLAMERGARVLHVQGPEDLAAEWFAGCDVVGLTAGTSTLDWTIARVHHALTSIPSTGPESVS